MYINVFDNLLRDLVQLWRRKSQWLENVWDSQLMGSHKRFKVCEDR